MDSGYKMEEDLGAPHPQTSRVPWKSQYVLNFEFTHYSCAFRWNRLRRIHGFHGALEKYCHRNRLYCDLE